MPRRACGAGRGGHRPAQPAGQLGRVAAQGDQRRHRQVRGQRDVDGRAGVPRPLAQQQVGVAHPLLDQRVVRRRARAPGRAGAAPRRSTSSAAAVSARRRPEVSGSAGQMPDRPLLERRVGRVVGRRLGPVHDLAGAVLARRPRGVQQRRRPARLDAVAPPAARAEQQVPGPGDGDVAEPDLLGDAEVLPLLHVVARAPASTTAWSPEPGTGSRSRGQLLAVGEPEIGGHRARVLDPGVAGVGLRRELVLGHARHGDDVPLEALGGVPGEQLDGLGVDRDLARLQAALALLGVAQVAEEGGQRRQLGQLGELGGDTVQRVEVRPGAGRAGPGRAGQLGLQPQGAGDLVDQVGQRLAQPVAQVGQLAAEPAEPAVARGRVRVGTAEVVERLDDAAALGGGSTARRGVAGSGGADAASARAPGRGPPVRRGRAARSATGRR